MSEKAGDISDLITSDEVIDRLMAEPSLRRRAVTCVLRAVKRGNEWFFRRSDLEAWISRHDPQRADDQAPSA